ncbi:hypothetical protein BU16DRAFT_616467 [Lophium mytilinum]|uniref:Uncharacterized protein n=1 Tax=Lophium mytilinum TaxID=390894 RepID=A0A6A6R3C2_9PEZI|nr:hypothetical protein BU16DRAFT_616467 [Lophium mytilinum]
MPRPMFPETKIRLAPLIKKVVPLVEGSAAGVILKVLSKELEDCVEHVEKKGKQRSGTKGKERENPTAKNERPQLESWVNEQTRRSGHTQHGEEGTEPQDEAHGGREAEPSSSRHHHRKHRISRSHILPANERNERERERSSRRPRSSPGRRHRPQNEDKNRHSRHTPRGEAEDDDCSAHEDSRFTMSGGAGPSSNYAHETIPDSPSSGSLSLNAFDNLHIHDAPEEEGFAQDRAQRPDSTDALVRPRYHPEEGRRRRRRRRERSPSPPKLEKWWKWGKYAAECVRYEAERIKMEEERKKRREKRRQKRREEARRGRGSGTRRGQSVAYGGEVEKQYDRVYPEEENRDDDGNDGNKTEGEVDPQFRTAGYRAGGFQAPQRQTRRDRSSIDLPPLQPTSASQRAKQSSRPATSLSSYSRTDSPIADRPSSAPTRQGAVAMPDPASFFPPLSKPPYPPSRTATMTPRIPSPFRSPSPIFNTSLSGGPSPEISMPSTPRPTEAMLANRTMLPSSLSFPTPSESRDQSSERLPALTEAVRSRSRSHEAGSDSNSDSGSWGGGGARADVRREMSERFADVGKGVAKGLGIGTGLWSGGDWGWDRLAKNEGTGEK